MKEMRVKGEYIHHQKIKGAMGIKISAPGLENAMAGAELLIARNDLEI
jgi:translation initiation factor 5B